MKYHNFDSSIITFCCWGASSILKNFFQSTKNARWTVKIKMVSFISKKQISVFLMLIFSCKEILVYMKRAKIEMSNAYVGYIKSQMPGQKLKSNSK